MAVPRDPTTAEIAEFLSTRTGREMAQLVQAIRQPAAQAVLTHSLLFVPPPVAGKIANPEKAKKALNAFVGFRCYYLLIPELKSVPMKKISNLMGVMWEKDQNKPLWSLLAKAWSTIRDQIGKEKAPLAQFLSIICPQVKMIPPEEYLERCGWHLYMDETNTPALFQELNPDLQTFSAEFADSTLSVEDIINYCQSTGYAQEYVADTTTTSSTFLAPATNASIHEERVAARNKRRARRQNNRQNGIRLELHDEIAKAHAVADAGLATTPYDIPAVAAMENEHDIFYHHLSEIVAAGNMGEPHEISAGVPSEFVHDEHLLPSGTPPLHWDDLDAAFRDGADEDATLPSFEFMDM
ncbi:MAT1-1-1 mating-type protein [Pyrenochaeta sp. DS3sAY3a]|nr:MAT1-1-1 mating-type protein [Pyrenochaeta sp. DS3sAY3a]